MFIVVVSLVSLDDFFNLSCPWLTIPHVSLKVNDADEAENFSEKAVVLALNLYQSDWSFTNIFLCRFLFFVLLFRWHACLRSLTRTVEILGEDSPLGIHVVPYCSSLSGRWVCIHTQTTVLRNVHSHAQLYIIFWKCSRDFFILVLHSFPSLTMFTFSSLSWLHLIAAELTWPIVTELWHCVKSLKL